MGPNNTRPNFSAQYNLGCRLSMLEKQTAKTTIWKSKKFDENIAQSNGIRMEVSPKVWSLEFE